MRAGSTTNRAVTHTSAQYVAARHATSNTEQFQLAQPALVFLYYAIRTMLTIAQFERPVRDTLARLLLLPLLEASADDDIAPRDSNRPAPSGDLS